MLFKFHRKNNFFLQFMLCCCACQCILPFLHSFLFWQLFFREFFPLFFFGKIFFRLNFPRFIVMHSPRYDLWIIIALKIYFTTFFSRREAMEKINFGTTFWVGWNLWISCMFIKYDNYCHFYSEEGEFAFYFGDGTCITSHILGRTCSINSNTFVISREAWII